MRVDLAYGESCEFFGGAEVNNGGAMSGDEVQEKVLAMMKEYEQRPILEQYAVFMGKAQILELGLKALMHRNFDVPFESMERWTLGKTKNELAMKGVRPDFIALLGSVVEYRNGMAHEFLANVVISRSIANFSDRMLYGDLFKGLYEIEQILVLYDWCEDNGGWMRGD